ncbi:hypothetical protein [Metabacillus fastidiosus]|nr:hypothetical protein [Metabacillus fastidiosus]
MDRADEEIAAYLHRTRGEGGARRSKKRRKFKPECTYCAHEDLNGQS